MVESRQAGAPLVTAPPGPLPVLYLDDRLVVVNKPSGLAAHRGMSSERDYVLTRARDQFGCRVHLVHRLDRATSGAMLLSFDPALVAPLQQAFVARSVDKRYLGLVRGVVEARVDVDYSIPKGEDHPERVSAQTTFVRLGVFEDRYTLLEAIPHTGRFHQIRRHASHLRHPILGDTRYGDRKENKAFRERFGLMRLALHARHLAFSHPVSGSRIAVDADLPADLERPLAGMGLVEHALGSRLGVV